MINRLTLGTVQFGLSYGVANTSGQVNRDEAAAILEHSWAKGINMLDTAIVYGTSEERLGEIGVDKWNVVSKLPEIPNSCNHVYNYIHEAVACSLRRLKIDHLYGLLLHRPHQLLTPLGEELYLAMDELKEQGFVEKIGISIYNPEELDLILPHFKLDLVQAPFNVLDRRLQTTGWLTRLHQAGTEVHVRSVFLQGLLLMEAGKRPDKFARWQPLWNQWHLWLEEKELTPVQACLGFVLMQPEIDHIIVGVDNEMQLQEIITAAEKHISMPPPSLTSEDPDLINPSRWNYL